MLDMIDSVPLEAHGALKYALSGCLLMIDEMVAMQHNLPRSDLSLRMVTTVGEQPSVHSELLHLCYTCQTFWYGGRLVMMVVIL
jgi:hypothetical protein